MAACLCCPHHHLGLLPQTQPAHLIKALQAVSTRSTHSTLDKQLGHALCTKSLQIHRWKDLHVCCKATQGSGAEPYRLYTHATTAASTTKKYSYEDSIQCSPPVARVHMGPP